MKQDLLRDRALVSHQSTQRGQLHCTNARVLICCLVQFTRIPSDRQLTGRAMLVDSARSGGQLHCTDAPPPVLSCGHVVQFTRIPSDLELTGRAMSVASARSVASFNSEDGFGSPSTHRKPKRRAVPKITEQFPVSTSLCA